MNDIQNSDIEALQILVREFYKRIREHIHNYDITFGSVIFNVNSDNTFTIQDESGVKRKVKCAIPGLNLTVGKSVWVRVPKGIIEDMHICGIK